MQGAPTRADLGAQPQAGNAGSPAIAVPLDATLEELNEFKKRLRKWNENLVVLPPNPSPTSGGHTAPPGGLQRTTPGLSSHSPRSSRVAASLFMGLPLDLFLETASYLHPKDLLALRLVCKALYSCLCDRRVWNIAIKGSHTVPELPRCPEDISPVRYSQLLFGHTCFACGRSMSRKVSYRLGLRLCKPCWAENIAHEEEASDCINAVILAHPELGADSRLRPPRALEYLRHDSVSKGRRQAHLYNRVELRLFAADYLPMLATLLRSGYATQDPLELAIRCRKDFVDLWNEFGEDTINFDAQTALEREKLSDARELNIIQRLQEMGHGSPSLPFGTDPEFHEWKKLVHKPEPLTDRKWTNLLPTLLELIGKIHLRRCNEAEQLWVTARMSFLLDLYDALMESHRVDEAERRCMPNHAHAQNLQIMATLARSRDFPHRLGLQLAFNGSADAVIAEARRFRQDTEDKLFALLLEHYKEHSPTLLSFPNRLDSYAASLFKCVLCAEDSSAVAPVPLHEVLAHWRQYHPDVLLNLGGPSGLANVPHPSNVRDGGSIVKPCPDSWYYIRSSQLSADITLATMDDLVARGLVYCPCKISLFYRYTWAELLAHCVKEVEWTYAMYPGFKELSDEDRRHVPDNHLPGCLTVVQNEAEVPQYKLPSDSTARMINQRLQTFGSKPHCMHCRNDIKERGIDQHTSSRRRKMLTRIVVSADQPWIEVTHHLRNKHNVIGYGSGDITFLPGS